MAAVTQDDTRIVCASATDMKHGKWMFFCEMISGAHDATDGGNQFPRIRVLPIRCVSMAKNENKLFPVQLHGDRESDKGWLIGGMADAIQVEDELDGRVLFYVRRKALLSFLTDVMHFRKATSYSKEDPLTSEHFSGDRISWIHVSSVPGSFERTVYVPLCLFSDVLKQKEDDEAFSSFPHGWVVTDCLQKVME